MSLKFRVADLGDVPEVSRPLYKEIEGGGGFRLDVEGAVDKSQLDSFRSNNIALTNKIGELEKLAEKWKDLDPEKAREALAELEKLTDKKMLDEGKLEEVIAARTERMRADLEGRIGALTKNHESAAKKAKDLEERLHRTLIDGEISKAVVEAGAVKPGAMRHIISMARDTWRLGDDGALTPVDDHGNTIFGSEAKVPLTPAEWAAGVMRDQPFLFEGSSGGGAGGGSNRGGTSPIVISRQQAASGAASLEDIASGKVQVQ